MRQGEMLALTLNDFDLEELTIDINKNWGVRKAGMQSQQLRRNHLIE